MKPTIVTLSVWIALTGVAMAQPSIAMLQNNYSYVLPGLPHYGIAQGSIFFMSGKNMGPASVTQQSFPLSRSLAGVSISVTSGSQTVQAIPYYVSASYIGAILPSATPVGSGTITVTYNGQASRPAAIQVVKSAFGILTMNGAGTGLAAAYDASYKFLSATNSANADETILLWGSGLGPAAGDETQVGTSIGDLASIPIQVWIGNKAAAVTYHGRSNYPGLDQINVVIPRGVSGCNVSVMVETGNMVSNSATIPIAAGGRVCSDPNGFSSTDLQNLLAMGTIRIGTISLVRGTANSGAITDDGSAVFEKIDMSTLLGPQGLWSQASVGSCTVLTYNLTNVPTFLLNVRWLNAGAALTLSGPNGTKPVARTIEDDGSILYDASLGNAYLAPGNYSVTGPGGPDVGAFSVNFGVPAPLVWTNAGSISTVARAQGVTVTWTGGDSSAFAVISGASMLTSDPPLIGMFSCTERVSAGSFTVPPAVLLALPPSAAVGGASISGSLGVGAMTPPVKFTASGLDLGYAETLVRTTKSVTYQ